MAEPIFYYVEGSSNDKSLIDNPIIEFAYTLSFKTIKTFNA